VSNPVRIEPVFVERVWGRKNLAPLFPEQERPTGEVWFPAGDDFPLLVKFIFTDERLSVQVHPDDDYAAKHENSRGKTEMWHILDARPGATIALGFTREVTTREIAAAIQDGTLVDLVRWVPVTAGDTLFAPAGTVHAIGAGITLCEIQQNSDVTYRLFDYGRPRQLHIEKGLQVCNLTPVPAQCSLPVTCSHFTVEELRGAGRLACAGAAAPALLITLTGESRLNSEALQPGDVYLISANAEPFDVELCPGARLLRATVSASPCV
jgi:mannose-6-phosphate isomerase